MAIQFSKYAHLPRRFADGTLDWDTDPFKLALVTSGYAFNAAHTQWADASAHEVAAGTGYTTGGATINNRSLTNAGLFSDPVLFPLLTKTFRGAVLYAVKTTNGLVNPLVGYVLFNDTPADTVVNDLDYTVRPNALGWFALG